MARIKAFTPATLDDPICVPIFDPETPGLSIRPLPSGGKRWQYGRRLQGCDIVVKLKLGPYPAYSIADAREWAGLPGLSTLLVQAVDPPVRSAEVAVGVAHLLHSRDLAKELAP